MKAVQIPPRNAIADFDRTIRGKPFNADRALLQALRPRVLAAYGRYRSQSPNLSTMTSSFTSATHIGALKGCYSKSSPTRKQIRTAALEAVDWCPYCEISAPSDCDHYLPRETHPELSIYYLNLVPSCSICNSPRSPFDDRRRRQKIHMIDDNVDGIDAMLVVRLSPNKTPVFALKKSRKTDVNLLYRRHFKAMRLAARYAKASKTALTSFVANVRILRAMGHADSEISRAAKSRATADELTLGKNHWRVALERAAARIAYIRSIT